jgi:hypothetical protein
MPRTIAEMTGIMRFSTIGAALCAFTTIVTATPLADGPGAIVCELC